MFLNPIVLLNWFIIIGVIFCIPFTNSSTKSEVRRIICVILKSSNTIQMGIIWNSVSEDGDVLVLVHICVVQKWVLWARVLIIFTIIRMVPYRISWTITTLHWYCSTSSRGLSEYLLLVYYLVYISKFSISLHALILFVINVSIELKLVS